MALVSAAAVAGTAAAAAAAYLDAKYFIGKDLRNISTRGKVMKYIDEAGKQQRLCLYYLFEEAALAGGSAECIWSRTGTYTWTETLQKVHQYARFFLSKGVSTGDLVGFYLQNSPEYIFAWFALWSIGAAPAMVNYHLAGEALIHCLEIAKDKEEGKLLVLVDEDEALRARVEGVRGVVEGRGCEILVLDDRLKAEIGGFGVERTSDELRKDVKADWPLALFYTSGTTGMPKGCPIRVIGGYIAGIQQKAGASATRPGERWYNCMPLYHGTGGMSSTTKLLSGTTLCIGKKFSVSTFWHDIRDSRSNWFTYVGETARYLLAAPPSPLDRAHAVRGMYGNGLRPDVWTRFQERFGIEEVGEFFNSTEGMLSMLNVQRSPFFRDCVGHHGLILRWMTWNSIVPVLVDGETGDLVRDGKTGWVVREPYESGGEMIVKLDSEHAFAGYFKNPAATQKMFVRDVFTKGDLWFRTGDKLRRDGEGKWFFVDRLGDTFRWKGENVATAEVAQVLGGWRGVVEANVYGVQVPGHDGRAGCAAIFVEGGRKGIENGDFDLKGFLKHARASLPKYAVPIFLRIVKEPTPMHNNKQNKVPLRNEGVDPDKVAEGDVVYWAPPGNDTYVLFERRFWEDLQGGKARL